MTPLPTYSKEACREINIACIVRLAKSGNLTTQEWARYGPEILKAQCDELERDLSRTDETGRKCPICGYSYSPTDKWCLGCGYDYVDPGLDRTESCAQWFDALPLALTATEADWPSVSEQQAYWTRKEREQDDMNADTRMERLDYDDN